MHLTSLLLLAALPGLTQAKPQGPQPAVAAAVLPTPQIDQLKTRVTELEAQVARLDAALGQLILANISQQKLITELSRRYKVHQHAVTGASTRPPENALSDAELQAIDRALAEARAKARK